MTTCFIHHWHDQNPVPLRSQLKPYGLLRMREAYVEAWQEYDQAIDYGMPQEERDRLRERAIQLERLYLDSYQVYNEHPECFDADVTWGDVR